MNKLIALAVPVVMLALGVGCSVSDDKPLADIDAGLWTKICKKATKDSVSETFECNGVEITVDATTASECETASNALSASGCSATFGDWRECQEWDPADPCDPGDPPAGCVALAACATPAE